MRMYSWFGGVIGGLTGCIDVLTSGSDCDDWNKAAICASAALSVSPVKKMGAKIAKSAAQGILDTLNEAENDCQQNGCKTSCSQFEEAKSGSTVMGLQAEASEDEEPSVDKKDQTCFPANAIVYHVDGRSIPMSQLEVGDKIKVPRSVPPFLFDATNKHVSGASQPKPAGDWLLLYSVIGWLVMISCDWDV